MDLLLKTRVGIRRPVRSTVYKAALEPGVIATFGLLLGTREQSTSPIFDAALVSCSYDAVFNLADVPKILSSDLRLCTEMAAACKSEPIGVFAAWDETFIKGYNQKLGLLVDATKELKLPYLAIFPTDGGESNWGVAVYFANRFPHDELRYRMLERQSDQAEDNPRRIKAKWKGLKFGQETDA